MTLPTKELLEWLIAAGVVTGTGWHYGIRPMVTKVRSFRQSWSVIASACETVPLLAAAVRSVEAELKPNGGSSLRDAINRIDKRVMAVESNATMVRAAQRATASIPSNAALLELDSHGGCLWANQSWVDLTKQSAAEYTGWGWLNAVHQSERDAVREEWEGAAATKSQFSSVVRLCRGECGVPSLCTPETRGRNGCASVRFSASPVVSGDRSIVGYIGVVVPL